MKANLVTQMNKMLVIKKDEDVPEEGTLAKPLALKTLSDIANTMSEAEPNLGRSVTALRGIIKMLSML